MTSCRIGANVKTGGFVLLILDLLGRPPGHIRRLTCSTGKHLVSLELFPGEQGQRDYFFLQGILGASLMMPFTMRRTEVKLSRYSFLPPPLA